ncbi:MAG: hypothetical protein PVJ21_05215 [Anaerolineales bacterium]|jgi:mono/diheme cytochrome c family protein
MTNNKTLLVLTLTLFASLIMASCGTQATPETVQNPDPQESLPTTNAEITEAPTPTEALQEVAPTEAPTEAPAEPSNASVSFANDVFPIIDSRCVNCHGGERIEEGLVMLSYDDLLAGSDNGPILVPGDPTNSLLVELVANQKMPKRGPKLTPPQVQIITEWVAAGAPNN